MEYEIVNLEEKKAVGISAVTNNKSPEMPKIIGGLWDEFYKKVYGEINDKTNNKSIGNVALYGATSGKAFISGVAGERFCVRNSGASAVVEGVGDHGCEYMTGGRVVVLGKTGKNFAAGMSGGIAYVLDEDNDLYTRMNKEMVFSEEISNKYDVMELKDMIKEHVALTNSEKGKAILDNFSEYLPKFKKVIPYDYNRMLMAIVQMEEKGLSSEQAQIEAFYANTRG